MVDEKMNESIAEFEDMGKDSHYPLMTTDPEKSKEFLIKVNDKHLQSVIVDNYIPTKKK